MLYVEADLARRPTPQMVADGAEWFRRFRPDVFGVEANQFQDLLAGEFEAEFRRQGILAARPLPIENHAPKQVRIRRLGPYLRLAPAAVHAPAVPARGSWSSSSASSRLADHDDGPDALEMAVRLAEEFVRSRTFRRRPGQPVANSRRLTAAVAASCRGADRPLCYGPVLPTQHTWWESYDRKQHEPDSRGADRTLCNLGRFPEDFAFQLSQQEFENWRSQIVTSNPAAKMGLRRKPYAFTEQGVAMLSSVLRSQRAVDVNVEIVRAFVRLRRMLAGNAELAGRLDALEQKYDAQFTAVFDAIRQLMAPESKPHREIGFHTC